MLVKTSVVNTGKQEYSYTTVPGIVYCNGVFNKNECYLMRFVAFRVPRKLQCTVITVDVLYRTVSADTELVV